MMESTEMKRRGMRAVLALLASTVLAACEEPVDLALPTAEQVESSYEYTGGLEED